MRRPIARGGDQIVERRAHGGGRFRLFRSIRHRDITFAGTGRGGVRIDFREPARAVGFNVPALYVTVEDLEGFAASLSARGIPGLDARRGR